MYLRTSIVVVVCGALALFGASDCSANLLTNGSFESPSVVPGNFLTIGPGQEASDGFTGWTVTSGNIDVVNATSPLFGITWGAQAAVDGSQILDLNGSVAGAITQSFATVSGQHYSVQIWYANNPLGTGGLAHLEIDDVGTTNASLLSAGLAHKTSTLTSPDWQLFTNSFVAQGTTTSFSLTSTSNLTDASGGVLLDAMSVTAVPEPASIVLCGIVFAVPLLLRRRLV